MRALGSAFRKLHWMSSQFGIDPLQMVRSIRGLPRFIHDLLRFRNIYNGRLAVVPCLYDWCQEGGVTKNEYFWQDLVVARMICARRPEKHVDIGSRVDGFVAHVASFREIEVFDIRPISTLIPGVIFKQADLMKPVEGMEGYCDSLSCLHALEHFGLGRYGDVIDAEGFSRGLKNMACLLKEKGIFYLSIPIGIERVEFNANRVLDPRKVIDLAQANSLHLTGFNVVRQGGEVELLELDDLQLSSLATQNYALGIFIFQKSAISSKYD